MSNYHYLFKYNVHWNLPILAENINKLKKIQLQDVSYYGCNNIYFNSGRSGERISNLEFLLNIKEITKRNIPCFVTLTNYYIDESHLDDKILNQILHVLSKSDKNGVICSSDTLNFYIKNNFPNLKTKCSILKSTMESKENDINWYLSMLDSFDYVVIHPDIKIENLNYIPKELRYRFEIIANENCPKNCKDRKQHYISMFLNKDFDCNKLGSSCELSDIEMKKLIDMGFIQYKLQGSFRGKELIKELLC